MFSASIGGFDLARRSAGPAQNPETSHLRSASTNFARSVRGACALNGRSSTEQGLQNRKDNDMIAALVVAWFAVVGLVLIARADYGRRPLTR